MNLNSPVFSSTIWSVWSALQPLTLFCENSCSQVFQRVAVLKKFLKILEKHQCRSPILIKLHVYSLNIIKKRLQHRCFAVNIQNFSGLHFLRIPMSDVSGAWARVAYCHLHKFLKQTKCLCIYLSDQYFIVKIIRTN